jgi:predicted nucleotidyltransferase
MKPSQALANHRAAIREIALRHHVSDIRIFGSVLRGHDIEGSDLDLLVEPTSETTLLDIGAIRHELRTLLGIEVDVLTPKALPDSYREQVLADAVPV